MKWLCLGDEGTRHWGAHGNCFQRQSPDQAGMVRQTAAVRRGAFLHKHSQDH